MTTQEHLAYITNYIQVHCPDKKQEIKKWIESYDVSVCPPEIGLELGTEVIIINRCYSTFLGENMFDKF